jgi:uncharacterized protein YjeT (DUF2065 family)
MEIETLIARWVAVLWLLGGLSHALHPEKWAALLMPLRERETGGLLLAAFNLPLGVAIVLGHNVWELGIPAIVTVAGWMTTLKSAMYLLFPRAHIRLMSAGKHPERAIRTIGIILIILGAIVGYDAFFRR